MTDDPSQWDAIATRTDLSLRSKLAQTWVSVFDGCCTCPPSTDTHRQREVALLELAFAAMARVAHHHFGVSEQANP